MNTYCGKLLALLIVCSCVSSGFAQTRSRAQPTNVVALDAQARNAQETFIKEMVDLSRSYQDAGQLEKAKVLLEAVLRINKELPGVQQKVDELNNSLLSANESEFEMDTSRGWVGPVARVAKGQAFRIRSSGNYKLVSNLTLGPDGIPKTDTPNDLAGNVPVGGLMGMVVTPSESNKGNKPNIKTGKPISIGLEQEITPQEDGLLFLRVNVPPGTEAKGSLKISLSGYIRAN